MGLHLCFVEPQFSHLYNGDNARYLLPRAVVKGFLSGGPRGDAFPPATHSVRVERLGGQEGKLVAEYGSPGGRLRKERLGRSFGVRRGPSAGARSVCRRRAKPAGHACSSAPGAGCRVPGARSHRQRSVKSSGRTIEKRQLTGPRESEPGRPERAGGAATPPAGWRPCAAGRPVSAAPRVADGRVAARGAHLLRPHRARLPSSASPPSSRPTLLPSPSGIAMDAASPRRRRQHRAGL